MTGTTIDNRAAISVLAKDLDDIWALIDRLLDSVPADSWSKRYGPDWTYADVPWHLAYFDRIMLAEVLESGAELPQPQGRAERKAAVARRRRCAGVGRPQPFESGSEDQPAQAAG